MSKTETKCQSLKERLDDEEKVQLDSAFVESLALTAVKNHRMIEDLWTMWQAYVQTCEGHDQSPTFREFCDWNNFIGAGPLA